jgi:hypothetical protein
MLHRLQSATVLVPLTTIAIFSVAISGVAFNPAAGADTCVGDCDNAGQVTVNEILEMVNIALDLDNVAACRAGDARGDGAITIDEILTAVTLALTGCPLTGAAAGEASTGVDDSTRDGTDAADRIIDFGKAGAGGGGGAGLTDTGGAALSFVCPAGGDFAVSSCSSGKNSSILLAVFKECRDVDPQTQAMTTRSGTLKLTIADPQACEIGKIRPDVAVTSEFTQFVVDRFDAEGRTITHVGSLRDVFQPSGQGCAAVNGTDTIDGALSVQHDLEGPAASYTYRTFVVQSSTLPNAAVCIEQKTLNGVLVVDDRMVGRSFSETAHDFIIATQTLAAQRLVSESGSLTVDCLGTARFRTLKPLAIVPGAACPVNGLLEVTLPASTTRVGFTPNGLSFDFNGDGEPDRPITSCLDPTLTQCRNEG